MPPTRQKPLEFCLPVPVLCQTQSGTDISLPNIHEGIKKWIFELHHTSDLADDDGAGQSALCPSWLSVVSVISAMIS
jgi:hypothetical protein